MKDGDWLTVPACRMVMRHRGRSLRQIAARPVQRLETPRCPRVKHHGQRHTLLVMTTRHGHFDPGSRHTPSEIVVSRTHIATHGWREVEITPAARRDVTPLEKKRRHVG